MTVQLLFAGVHKIKLYTSPPRDLVDLRMRIIREFEALINDDEMLIRSVAEMRSRSHKFIERNGGHVEGY